MIIATGASGQLGQAITERLLERVSAEQIGVSVRDPQQTPDLEDRDVRVRRGDFKAAESLAHALSLGATLVTNNTREFERVPGHRIEDWTRSRKALLVA